MSRGWCFCTENVGSRFICRKHTNISNNIIEFSLQTNIYRYLLFSHLMIFHHFDSFSPGPKENILRQRQPTRLSIENYINEKSVCAIDREWNNSNKIDFNLLFFGISCLNRYVLYSVRVFMFMGQNMRARAFHSRRRIVFNYHLFWHFFRCLWVCLTTMIFQHSTSGACVHLPQRHC